VGEWVLEGDATRSSRSAAPEYLIEYALPASFIVWVLRRYFEQVDSPDKTAQRNLSELSHAQFLLAAKAYQLALNEKLASQAKEQAAWYWAPNWQLSEAEADLDQREGRSDEFESVEQLLSNMG